MTKSRDRPIANASRHNRRAQARETSAPHAGHVRPTASRATISSAALLVNVTASTSFGRDRRRRDSDSAGDDARRADPAPAGSATVP
jgi:hypothetical protein